MTRLTVRRFDVTRTATTVAMIYVVVVLIYAVIFGLFTLLLGGLISSIAGDQAGTIMGIGIFGIAMFAIFGSIAAFIFGWIGTAIACLIYNAAAGRTGGIQIEAELSAPVAPAPNVVSTPVPPAS